MNGRVSSLLVCLCCAVGSSYAVESALEVLRTSGINGGVFVHIGCGDGRDAVQLGQAGRWVVCGLDRDAGAVQAARARTVGAGLSGPISVMLWSGGALPFIDNTVNLIIVVEDRAAVDIEECKQALNRAGSIIPMRVETVAGKGML
jgi:SAM-dependent methyltransferase